MIVKKEEMSKDYLFQKKVYLVSSEQIESSLKNML